MARKYYDIPDLSEAAKIAFYLHPFSNDKGIGDEALKYLSFTRGLIFKFYKEKDM